MLDLTFQLKAVGAFVALVLAGNVLRAKLRSRSHLPLPPGPPGHWLFGNLLPSANQSQQFAEWINTYGPIISLRVGPGRVMVIIGRHQEANDIMEKEGGVLADRPRAVAAEIVSRGLYVILVRPGEQFRRLRKAAHTYLQAKAADSYAPIQMDAARDVILDILDNPKGHQAAVNRYSVSVILRVMYGKSTPTTTEALRPHSPLRAFTKAHRIVYHIFATLTAALASVLLSFAIFTHEDLWWLMMNFELFFSRVLTFPDMFC